MMGRGELTDPAWVDVELLLLPNGQHGGQWWNHRTVINGILRLAG